MRHLAVALLLLALTGCGKPKAPAPPPPPGCRANGTYVSPDGNTVIAPGAVNNPCPQPVIKGYTPPPPSK